MRRFCVWVIGLTVVTCAVHAQTPAPDDPLLENSTAGSNATTSSEARGVLRARDQAVLASELSGRIVELPFSEGESFKKGDTLARFDCSAYQAQLNAAQAANRGAGEELSHNKQLAALNSVGRFEVARAQAKVSETQAQSQVYQVQVKRCSVLAPFDGQVVERKVKRYESVAAGAPLLDVVDNRTLEIHLLVPSRWMARLKPGQTFSFVPDETGQALDATVKRLGARIDEGSQTLLLVATLPNANGLLAGMSGTARFAELK
ncbi:MULTISPECIES: efflux RND transporter periplasmic adaptor subunit [Pseudomonas]|jgi:RND family efflux transporter MFP subunit|uniref:RND family efflux transporter, MFP subunit n=1 Tax=Pseudomonas mandelii TaxID=75612 RepID=A0ABY0VHQ0_9PSED|nr:MULTISPECIES: efflux RND transporter periplasmic adaptor subunit [Pseudomonas]MDO8402943.1 efflux RND transporter periplasmic adaptor subunit [Pseudomonas sp.]MDO8708569.1 efflux RND transporter periplasmic adaptor subunit [Pseudomonas sp.]QKG67988.1 efflux RND transporter periplasmic adaptor subunit [Pseudomonas sp. B14-6]QQN99108.1 efflux RND transporter periplasmic adaptor subunit [Pseudomonas sp. SW-3]QZA98334.1 efflux RND transporter periplasmic adaptor subunit [Pseudomonas mandelii]